PSPVPASPPSASSPADSAFLAAQAELSGGNVDAAMAQVEQTLRADPGHVDAYLLKAELLFRTHRSDEMIPVLERALTHDADRLEVHANLAYALHYAGRLDEAEQQVQWCLQRRPDHAAVRRVLASLLRDRGDIA